MLAVEMFKVLKQETPEIMGEVIPLKIRNEYDFRAPRQFNSRKIKTVHYGNNSIAFLAPKIWAIVPNEIKESSTIAQFQRKIKKWIPSDCPCRLCKKYVPNLGFL